MTIWAPRPAIRRSGCRTSPNSRRGKYWDDGPDLAYSHLRVFATAAEAVVAYFMDKGYNTNYASSWFLVRGGPQLQSDGAMASVGQTPWARSRPSAARKGPFAATVGAELSPLVDHPADV